MISYRLATYADHPDIADIHATNWLQNYQEVLDADYLANEVHTDRLKVWQDRLGLPKSNQYVILAMIEDQIIGFACAYLDYDEQYGHYLDNLHVRSAYQGQGIGRTLIHHLAQLIHAQSKSSALFLWVFVQNTAATRTYINWGGVKGDTQDLPMPSGGGGGLATRIIWSNSTTLINHQLEDLHKVSYKPVDCNKYDHFEIAAIRRQTITIRFKDYPTPYTGHIKTLLIDQKVEYLITQDGHKIRLDRIAQLLDKDNNVITQFDDDNSCQL
jgi:ribosomal protein S18 acetylase RimI-like enzyme/transcriptional antiterminator Rof (Rho-off)